jgi:hypothetical protein
MVFAINGVELFASIIVHQAFGRNQLHRRRQAPPACSLCFPATIASSTASLCCPSLAVDGGQDCHHANDPLLAFAEIQSCGSDRRSVAEAATEYDRLDDARSPKVL